MMDFEINAETIPELGDQARKVAKAKNFTLIQGSTSYKKNDTSQYTSI